MSDYLLLPRGISDNNASLYEAGVVIARYDNIPLKTSYHWSGNPIIYVGVYRGSTPSTFQIMFYSRVPLYDRGGNPLVVKILSTENQSVYTVWDYVTHVAIPTRNRKGYYSESAEISVSGMEFMTTLFNTRDDLLAAMDNGVGLQNFIYVPGVTKSTQAGEQIIVYDNYNPYRVAYVSTDEQSIRSGILSVAPEHKRFYFASPGAIQSGINVYLQSPYGTIVAEINSISIKNPVGEGYFNTIDFTKDRLSTSMRGDSYGVKWFNDETELLSVLAFTIEPEPGDNSGVVVTSIGTPLAPDTNGVIVYCTSQLLDPNKQGGTSEPGGGTGTFNDTSDPIPISPLPELSAANVGLVTLFRPSEIQLRSLGSYLWTNITDFIENLNKLFINPMDYMIALNIFPCNPNVGNERPIKIGSFSTTISMPPVLSQWYEHNCGTLVTNEYWGSALDYAPNTKISLMLPFIGNVQLNPDEIMGKRLGIKYRIDLLSGQCVALISVDDNILYQFTGECSVSIPLTGSDWSRVYSAVVGAIGTAITTGVSTGGIIDVAKTTGRTATAGDRIRRANSIAAGRITGGIANTVNQVMNGKGGINHSGSISGSAGMLGMRYPYLMIEFPNQSLADNYRHFVGYPSNMSSKLGDLKGYTEVEQVIPEGFWGTDDELAELVEALKGGVYL